MLVEQLAAHRAPIEQVPRPLQVAPRIAHPLLGGTQRCPPLRHLLRPKAALELGQQGARSIHLRLGGAPPGQQLRTIEPRQLGPALHPVTFAHRDPFDAPSQLETEIGFSRLHRARSLDRLRIARAQQDERDGRAGDDDSNDNEGVASDLLHRAFSRFATNQAGSSSPTTRISSTRAAI